MNPRDAFVPWTASAGPTPAPEGGNNVLVRFATDRSKDATDASTTSGLRGKAAK